MIEIRHTEVEGGAGCKFSIFKCHNSAAYRSIYSLQFDTEFDHRTPDVIQTCKVKGSKVKVKVTA